MLVTLTELLEEAERENKAIGSFSTFNMEMTMGIIKAAEELQKNGWIILHWTMWGR